MKKVMLVQPMGGKTDNEISVTKHRAVKYLTDQGYEIVNTLFTSEWYNTNKPEDKEIIQRPLFFLARSLEHMSLCHAVYFCQGWEEARGCIIEHEAAKAYGLEIIYE